MSINSITPPPELLAEIAHHCEREVAQDLSILTDTLKTRFGDSLVAIILYGSCLRTNQYHEGVVDLYVVVSNYMDAYTLRSHYYMNTCLPPNVYYLEVGLSGSIVRLKYAVISSVDLEQGCTRWFHSYIWSRFAQPVRLLYVRDLITRNQLYNWFAIAVVRFHQTTIPALDMDDVDTSAIWENGLALTYAAELRPERHNRAAEITEQNLEVFSRLTSCAVPALSKIIQPVTPGRYLCVGTTTTRKQVLRLWRIRRWQGLALSVLRLTKAVFTFHNSVDYAAWKIQRHTGVIIVVSNASRRHPILFGFSVLWQLIKRDVVH